MCSNVWFTLYVVIYTTCCSVLPVVMSTSDDGPLPDTLQATLKAEVDASRLNNQIRGLINNTVKHAVENSFGVVMKNVTDQLKEDLKAEWRKWLVPNVSFHARISQSIPNIDPWATAIFKHVINNNGGGYDKDSGIFTAPVKGTYFFASTILTKTPSVLEMCLKVNGNIRMLLYASAKNETYNNAANSVVLNLNQNDQVMIVKHGVWGSRPFYIHASWSTFTGMLINYTN